MEDKVYFQSSVTHDLAADHELIQFTRLTHTQLTVLRTVVCIALCFCVWLTSIIDNSWALSFYCSIFIVSHFITWLQLRKGSPSYKQRLVYNHGVPMTNIMSCTEEGIRCVNPSNENVQTYEYAYVERISETKNFLILRCKENLGLIMDKRSLTGGTKEEFIDFLRNRCPNMKKKVRNDTTGKVLAGVYILVLAVVFLIGVFRLPFVSDFTDKVTGRIPDSASYAEIAAELEELGITGINEELLESLEDFSSSYSYYDTAYYKTLDILGWLGMGEYDEESWDWTPSHNGVFWMDAEVYDIQYMYTDYLMGVSALDEELDFQIIKEWTEFDSWDTGEQFVRFSWNGKEHTLSGELYYDWFDFQVAADLNEIIQDADTGKRLYFAYDGGQGVLVFYRDAQWAKEFQRKTGIALSTDPNSVW